MRLVSRKALFFFFLPGALFMGLFLIYPVVKMGVDSFYAFSRTGEATFVGFENYIEALTTDAFLKPLRNTLVYIVVAVSVELVLGLAAALVYENHFKGGRTLRSLMLTPLMLAPLVAGLIWKLLLSAQFGIVNELLVRMGILSSNSGILWLADKRWALLSCCIADIWLTTPFMMLMIMAGLRNLDASMIEAAKMDGANALQTIFLIKLPNIKTMILTALSIRIIDAARTFDIIWGMTEGGPNKSSEVISVVIYRTLARYGKVGFASAMGIIFVIALVAFTLIAMQSLWRPEKTKKSKAGAR